MRRITALFMGSHGTNSKFPWSTVRGNVFECMGKERQTVRTKKPIHFWEGAWHVTVLSFSQHVPGNSYNSTGVLG